MTDADSSDDMIPEGSYKARAAPGGTLGRAESSGNEQVGVAVTLLDGPAAGQTLTWYGYFTEKTFDRTIESLRIMGWGGSDVSDLEGLGSTEFYAVVKHEVDPDGVVHARLAWINGSQGVAMRNRMDAGEAKAFADRIRGAVIAHGAGQRGARPPARPAAAPGNAAPASAPPPDDDIPF